jgi:hypothetical protein
MQEDSIGHRLDGSTSSSGLGNFHKISSDLLLLVRTFLLQYGQANGCDFSGERDFCFMMFHSAFPKREVVGSERIFGAHEDRFGHADKGFPEFNSARYLYFPVTDPVTLLIMFDQHGVGPEFVFIFETMSRANSGRNDMRPDRIDSRNGIQALKIGMLLHVGPEWFEIDFLLFIQKLNLSKKLLRYETIDLT